MVFYLQIKSLETECYLQITKKPLLTDADKILKGDFGCKSNWGQTAG